MYIALEAVLRDPRGTSEKGEEYWKNFTDRLREAQFLFRDELRTYLMEIRDKASLLRALAASSGKEGEMHRLADELYGLKSEQERFKLFERFLGFDVLNLEA